LVVIEKLIVDSPLVYSTLGKGYRDTGKREDRKNGQTGRYGAGI
jgi:hypothetical protein